MCFSPTRAQMTSKSGMTTLEANSLCFALRDAPTPELAERLNAYKVEGVTKRLVLRDILTALNLLKLPGVVIDWRWTRMTATEVVRAHLSHFLCVSVEIDYIQNSPKI